MEEDLENFLDYLEVIKKHSPNTILNYREDIIEFIKLNPSYLNINKDNVESYLNYLYQKNDSKSSISRKLSSLRSFYNYLLNNNKISYNYFTLYKNPKKDKSLPKLVKLEDVEKMFTIPNTRTPLGQRNLLIIRLLFSTGVRVSELVNIKLKDINISERTINILGKGSKERVVLFGYNTKDILELYLKDGREKLLKDSTEYLILNYDGNVLSARYVREIINDIIFKASIELHVSPHMLRHTFATILLNNGSDLVSVKDLLGHSSLNTTTIYTHVSDDKIKEIYNKAHPRA